MLHNQDKKTTWKALGDMDATDTETEIRAT